MICFNALLLYIGSVIRALISGPEDLGFSRPLCLK